MGGMVEGKIPLPGQENGQRSQNRRNWVHLMLDGVFFYHRHLDWQFYLSSVIRGIEK